MPEQCFPTILYKSPGPLDAGNGSTYSYAGCNDAVDLEIALASGWHLSLPDALEAAKPVDQAALGQLEIELAVAKSDLAAADEKLAAAASKKKS